MADGERTVRQTRFHGRVGSGEARCDAPGCEAPGEFRAPREHGHRSGGEGPRHWRWLCLDHVRDFNDRYNYFAGMSAEEISDAQRPYGGWDRETRAFATNGDPAPKWADFADPLDAIGARFGRGGAGERPRADGRPLSQGECKALAVLGLSADTDRRALRSRYAELVRRYHPDRNGGDRSHERTLQDVIAAYALLKGARAFA